MVVAVETDLSPVVGSETEMNQIVNTRTRQQWAKIINADWRKSIDAIFLTGENLKAAEAELSAADYSAMIREDLDLTPKTAAKLIKIVNNAVLGATSTRDQIPASWAVLRPSPPRR